MKGVGGFQEEGILICGAWDGARLFLVALQTPIGMSVCCSPVREA